MRIRLSQGYSHQIGIFVSQLSWMRCVVASRLKDLSQENLDWCPDESSNSIRALFLHLAATDVYYGLNAFEDLPWENIRREQYLYEAQTRRDVQPL